MEGLAKIGIDLPSVLFYLLNFGVIVVILAKFVYAPAMKFLDERREAIRNNLEESTRLREDFALEINEQKRLKEQETLKLRQAVENMQQEAEAKQKKLIQEAEAERDRMILEAKQQSEVMRNELINQVEKELLGKVNNIVNEAVKKQLSGEEAMTYVFKAWKEIREK